MEKLKQKITERAYHSAKQGSILAYSLIVLSVMLVIAVGVSSVSIIGKKSASTTTSSTQTLQTADSGIKLAIKKIEASLGTDQVKDKFTCNGSGDIIMDSTSTGLPGEVVINFFKSDGTTLVACSDSIDQIANIKSIGKINNTTRAVQVALATSSTVVVAGGSCINGVNNHFGSSNTIWGGASCVGYVGGVQGGCISSHATVSCPTGTTKQVLLILDNCGIGGESVICMK